jgi:hypothetical protein
MARWKCPNCKTVFNPVLCQHCGRKRNDRRVPLPSLHGEKSRSGGLVVSVTETRVGQYAWHGIGVASQMVPFVEELWSKQYLVQTGVRYENSGYSLVEPMDPVLELIQ